MPHDSMYSTYRVSVLVPVAVPLVTYQPETPHVDSLFMAMGDWDLGALRSKTTEYYVE